MLTSRDQIRDRRGTVDRADDEAVQEAFLHHRVSGDARVLHCLLGGVLCGRISAYRPVDVVEESPGACEPGMVIGGSEYLDAAGGLRDQLVFLSFRFRHEMELPADQRRRGRQGLIAARGRAIDRCDQALVRG